MSLSVNNHLGGTITGLSGASITTGNAKTAKVSSFGKGKAQTKKAIKYNSKEISSQLLRAKKSRTAATVLSKAKSSVSNLQRCLGTGEYDDGEVRIALAHAKRMVKCAQSKVNNLKEEENLQRKYEREKKVKERQQKSEVKRRAHQKERNLEQKIASEELQKIQKEKSQRQEILRKRRLHRNEEHGKVSEADMKYLKSTIDYMQNGYSVQTDSVTVQLSDAGMQMSHLQQAESTSPSPSSDF